MAKRKTRTRQRAKAQTDLVAHAPGKDAPRRSAVMPISTHKARAAWFNAREAWPMREAPVASLLRARADVATNIPSLSATAVWEQAGPVNVGGRTTSIAVDPDDAQRIWIGSAGGGVWSSADGGLTWTPLWHAEPTLNIGSLCLDPTNANTVYCGTGEANLSADSHAGVGLYRSLDGGATWHLLAPAESHGLPKRIGHIAVDPSDSNHIFLAGVGHRPQDARGLFRSTNGGQSWAAVTALFASPYQCHDVVFHPTTIGTLYAAIDALGSASGVWRSTDGGQIWTHLTSGLPASPRIARTRIAIAPSNPKVVYTQMATRQGDVLGVFRSANGGQTWKTVSGHHFTNERQMNYNNTISVDPTSADTVICGGVDLHRTKNGGQTWKKVTDWRARRNDDTDYAHADQHALHHHPSQSGLIYAVNDGGFDLSEDGGETWRNRSAGLATNMFYDLSVAATDGNMYGGGMQDNGTWLTLDGQPNTFLETTGGDGGFCAIDSTNALHLFTSSQFMRLNRFRQTDGWSRDVGPNETGPRPWMAFIAMDPQRPKRVFVGSRRVWRSVNDGASWKDTSGSLDDSFVTCIEISRGDTDRLYVGTENGGIFKSEDGGSTWSGNLASSVLPGRTVTRVRTAAADPDLVYATVANFGTSHLFRSTDGGVSDADAGALPDVPHHGIVIPSHDGDVIYVAGDAGVFVSLDGAATWHNVTLNLPTVAVVDLVLHEASETLIAATYGRSTWRLDVSSL